MAPRAGVPWVSSVNGLDWQTGVRGSFDPQRVSGVVANHLTEPRPSGADVSQMILLDWVNFSRTLSRLPASLTSTRTASGKPWHCSAANFASRQKNTRQLRRESFNRPGGNSTGITLLTNQLEPKRLGLLRQLVPSERGATLCPPGR
jgi:hypothetical protein